MVEPSKERPTWQQWGPTIWPRGIPDPAARAGPTLISQRPQTFSALRLDLAGEFSFSLRHLAGAGASSVSWLQARFQVKNIKVLLRVFLNRTPLFKICLPPRHETLTDISGTLEERERESLNILKIIRDRLAQPPQAPANH